jgi:colanic acid biosynthesis protein WcaH
MQNKISKGLYKKFLKNMPIFCVDLIIDRDKKVLLVKRKDEPCKNQWWVPGGRVYKNEKTEDAAIRKARGETGLDVEIVKRVGFYEPMLKEAQFGIKTGTHNPVVVYHLKSKSDQEVYLDETSSGYRWIDRIETDMDDYMKTILKDSKVFD